MKASFPYWLLCFISLSMSMVWLFFILFVWPMAILTFFWFYFFMDYIFSCILHPDHSFTPNTGGPLVVMAPFHCSQKLLNSSVWSWHLWPISLWSYFLVVSRQDSGTTDRAGCGHASLGKSCVGWKMGGTFLNASGSHEPSDMGPGSQI